MLYLLYFIYALVIDNYLVYTITLGLQNYL